MMRNSYLVFILMLFVRLLSVYVVQTSFVPDEYWQSIEIAHRKAFGYGYITWEWKKQIRSYIYPFLFELLYLVFPDSPIITKHLPRLFQSILSTCGEFAIYKLSVKLFGNNCGSWTLFNIITSWFLFYCSPRTISNMAEASFTACGLYFYPWSFQKEKGLTCKYLWFAGASIMIRPTGFILWLPLYCWHAIRANDIVFIIKNTALKVFLLLSLLIAVDYYYYGEFVVSHYNFFLFNWKNDIGAFYGEHHFLWYMVSGLPSILGVHFIPFFLGLFVKKIRHFYLIILWFLVFLSLPSHKEFRFLLPIMHLSLMCSSVVMNEIAIGRMFVFGHKLNEKLNAAMMIAIILINVPLSIYVSLFHQRGTIDAVSQLSSTATDNSSILFLMPCHSTPYYSYMHKDIPMRFLLCEPNFSNDVNYIEEAEEFFQDAPSWLQKNYESSNVSFPSHIVMFDSLYSNISPFLFKHKYEKCFSTFHSHFPSGRVGKHVFIFCKGS
ncbi:GPI mannosyltransferase 3-like [Uloborus diversus]|uniref:GPI mannosyltransferase 3-like n=1 Tax=Uloborus diversus TaxID=327109 RepID=UPI00240A8FBE|nr:GPI mannosyltransferase 3-like [Uloborus diversus]